MPPQTIPTTTQNDTFEDEPMPEPFEYSGGDENIRFYQRCVLKLEGFDSRSFLDAEIFEYLGNDDFTQKWYESYDNSWWPNATSLMDFPNKFERIVANNIPDDVVIKGLSEEYEFYAEGYKKFENGHINLAISAFSEEEIKILLTRDEATVLAHFATEEAIVIGDRVYSPEWVYYHTPDDYAKAGITSKMIEQRLDLYAKLRFTQEADTAFSRKLSWYIGEDVSLREIRAKNHSE